MEKNWGDTPSATLTLSVRQRPTGDLGQGAEKPLLLRLLLLSIG